jgi:methionyl aminopeptidase
MARRPRRGNRRGGRRSRRPRPVVGHYRTLGLLLEGAGAAMIPSRTRRGSPGCARRAPSPPRCLSSLKPLVRPGITTMDLEEAGRAEIARLGRGAPATDTSTVRAATRRTPASRSTRRWSTESPRSSASCARATSYRSTSSSSTTATSATTPHGARPPVSPGVEKLLRVTREALDLGIRGRQVGNRIGDISSAIQTFVEGHGLSVVRDMVGHGVGVAMHEPPEIPNFGRRGTGDRIRPGMTFAIEPMVNLGGYATRTLSDGWTVVSADGRPRPTSNTPCSRQRKGPGNPHGSRARSGQDGLSPPISSQI